MENVIKALRSIGEYWRSSEITICKSFLVLSAQCEHRKATCYRTDVNGKKYFAMQCTKKTDPHDWGCEPTGCPYIGYISPISMTWQEIEPKPKEAD